jgi:hypothetical protein
VKFEISRNYKVRVGRIKGLEKSVSKENEMKTMKEFLIMGATWNK